MKSIFKPNWVNCIAAVVFFVIGLFVRLVPAWMKMKSGAIFFIFEDFNRLLFENNRIGHFATPVYYANWGISYLFILLELAVVYSIASLAYSKIIKPKKH